MISLDMRSSNDGPLPCMRGLRGMLPVMWRDGDLLDSPFCTSSIAFQVVGGWICLMRRAGIAMIEAVCGLLVLKIDKKVPWRMENVKCRCQKGRPAEYRQFIISGTHPAVASCRNVASLCYCHLPCLYRIASKRQLRMSGKPIQHHQC